MLAHKIKLASTRQGKTILGDMLTTVDLLWGKCYPPKIVPDFFIKILAGNLLFIIISI